MLKQHLIRFRKHMQLLFYGVSCSMNVPVLEFKKFNLVSCISTVHYEPYLFHIIINNLASICF